jgi:hypothetical protein
VRLDLYVCPKNICDGVGGQDESNGTPLDPPLFWLDNFFKGKQHISSMKPFISYLYGRYNSLPGGEEESGLAMYRYLNIFIFFSLISV